VGEAVSRVLLALVAAHLAGQCARLEGSARRRGIEGGLARKDLAGRQAHVGAVEAEADAADHLVPLWLGKVGIGVSSAGLSAVEARLNALQERVHIHGRLAEVGSFNGRGVRHG